MRILITSLFFAALLTTVKGQSSFAGEYKMTQAMPDSSLYAVTLKLNCNATYSMATNGFDSSRIFYGKWKMNKNDLMLTTDSMVNNGITYKANNRLVYENIDNRFHLKSVSRKDYNDMIKEVKKYFPQAVASKKGFEDYERQQKASYYEKVTRYDCK
ncbi:hypothetical protein [Ferruginibacter sp.]